MVVSRTLVEPNTAMTGVMLEASFARLRVSMAAFSEGRAPFCLFGCWDLSVIVETELGSYETTARRSPRRTTSGKFVYACG